MPLAHNLNKVNKNLSKSTASIHIKGRKFKQVNRATLRDKKLNEKRLKSLEQKENELAIVYFMQNLIKGTDEDEEAVKDYTTQETFTLEELKEIVSLFLQRYNPELEKLRSERRPGRPQTNRQQILEELVKHERHLYETGIKIPDLTQKETVQRLKAWNGTTGGATIFKYITIDKNMTSLPTKEATMTE